MSGVLEESFQVAPLELDDVMLTPDVTTISHSSPPNNLPQPGTHEMMDSAAATTDSPSTPSNGEGDGRTTRPVVDDESVCKEFIEQTCGCKRANGRPCSSLFSLDYYIERRAQACLLTRNELDLVMLGSIMSTTRIDDVTHGRHKPVKRQRPRACYMHNGCEICKVTFGFIFGVGRKHRIDAIRNHYAEEGLTTRVHKNSKLRPHNALSFDDITKIANFLQNYSEQHAILLPGRIPAYKRDDMKLLPCSDTKKVTYISTLQSKNYYIPRAFGICMKSHPSWLT